MASLDLEQSTGARARYFAIEQRFPEMTIEMKNCVFALALTVGIAGCAQTTRSIEAPGHPYKTDPTCRRGQPVGRFDQKCDYPRLGYRGFCPWLIGINN
jgi:hypothetical protein